MADHQEASVTLPSAPASVPAARAYVANVLAEWGLGEGEEAADTVRLIVSELATNAVQHTLGESPTFTVDIRLDHDGRLEIGVTDSHPRHPRRLCAAAHQDNGRGLVIIGCLAAESGGEVFVTPTADGGKTVGIALPWTVPVR
ncbi:ATP-binding protein [Streptomyces botrytidirepellens]|uniref:ATP-binding protein n=1 Tax=Streptomyces botrytidirepellens TaxID=2486417 RepID=A0A3M8UG88_9ACTN|nr:ATP-binding protein [Streptomyces botrytidirepellens]RNG04309.1 ATP-binding protein [Streptomyces botrytidirepellens]